MLAAFAQHKSLELEMGIFRLQVTTLEDQLGKPRIEVSGAQAATAPWDLWGSKWEGLFGCWHVGRRGCQTAKGQTAKLWTTECLDINEG